MRSDGRPYRPANREIANTSTRERASGVLRTGTGCQLAGKMLAKKNGDRPVPVPCVNGGSFIGNRSVAFALEFGVVLFDETRADRRRNRAADPIARRTT